jgi:hypothetical protein
MPSSLPATANSFSVAIYYTQDRGTSFLVILPSLVCLSPFLTPLLCNTHTVSQLVIRTVFSSFLCFIEKVSLQNLIYAIMLLTYFELVLFSLVYRVIREEYKTREGGKRSPLCNLQLNLFFLSLFFGPKRERYGITIAGQLGLLLVLST